MKRLFYALLAAVALLIAARAYVMNYEGENLTILQTRINIAIFEFNATHAEVEK